MSSQIPVRNIYFLLCYAWDKLQEGAIVNVDNLDSTELVDLFATVLINGVNHIVRRGLDRGYEIHEEELSSLRGKIDVTNSARRMLLSRGKAHCSFDEFTVNTLPNRIIKSTLKHLVNFKGLDKGLRRQLFVLHRDLHDVEDIRLNKFAFRKVQLNFNNRFYGFLLNICELVHSQSLLDESSGSYKFKDFIRDDKAMARLYESFLLNFFKTEFPELKPKSEVLNWNASSQTDPHLNLLPSMRTDISLTSQERKLVIDAKYYSKTLQSYFDKQSFHSGNLYQLLAYLDCLSGDTDLQLEGMLLYPLVNESLNESYEINGKTIHIKTINLTEDWKNIASHLRSFAVNTFLPKLMTT
jgi:5-methylcytosine-specific restriction enzyme subunit McrC